MAGVRKQKHGNQQGWWNDFTKPKVNGRYVRVWFRGTADWRDTLDMAQQLESKSKKIAAGLLPKPKPSDTPRDFATVANEYLAWGKSQGGIGGRPWALQHLTMKTSHLEFFAERLSLEFVHQITLANVEEALRELQTKGRKPKYKNRTPKPMGGKTLSNYSESIHSFCDWARSRGYLEVHPLEGMAGFDKTPKITRRALTVEEIVRVLECARRPEDRLLFEVALCAGYRRGELKALRVSDLDVENCSLPLAAHLCKGRKDARQPIPAQLAESLQASVTGKSADASLLLVADKPHLRLYMAMEDAGIQKMAAGGKVDLHALRVAYTTMVAEQTKNPKSLQTLARHSDLKVTLKYYAKARDEELHRIVEGIGAKILKPCAAGVPIQIANGGEVSTTTAPADSSTTQIIYPHEALHALPTRLSSAFRSATSRRSRSPEQYRKGPFPALRHTRSREPSQNAHRKLQEKESHCPTAQRGVLLRKGKPMKNTVHPVVRKARIIARVHAKSSRPATPEFVTEKVSRAIMVVESFYGDKYRENLLNIAKLEKSKAAGSKKKLAALIALHKKIEQVQDGLNLFRR